MLTLLEIIFKRCLENPLLNIFLYRTGILTGNKTNGREKCSMNEFGCQWVLEIKAEGLIGNIKQKSSLRGEEMSLLMKRN